ncbi:uncharacterized protein LOC117654542 [Thrips palmi]|uniref:Uncharacterized protein LOC117654542 n=1 Tax=Thrips palmi TaxID=161013 RepID=A0A6P9AFI3_THRPL|nr:uncharacterized protein LOC117654542 [Thrips palmi]
MLLCRIVGYRPMLYATNKDDQRPRVPPGGAQGPGAATGTPYWGPVDNNDHVFFSSYGMAPGGARQPLYYRVAHDPLDPHYTQQAERGFSLLHPSRVHPFVYPYPYYPYAYPFHHHHHANGNLDLHAAHAEHLSQTWPPRGNHETALQPAEPLPVPETRDPGVSKWK